MIIVTKATTDDLEEYLKLSAKFHSQSTIKDYAPFSPENMKTFLINSLNNPDIAIFVCKENNKLIGITGGLLFPLYFNHNYKVVQELWWWLDPESRGSTAGNLMYNALENWAKEKQANAMFMIALEDNRVETMSKIYKRKGFVGTERTFIKELNNGN
jgi:RimJ/RimL family protein N-acetyltransferase